MGTSRWRREVHSWSLHGRLNCWLKNTQLDSWELILIWDKMRTAAGETAPQTALRDCSKEALREGQCIIFWWRRSSMHLSTHFTKGSLLVTRSWCHYEGIECFSRYEVMQGLGSWNQFWKQLTCLKTCFTNSLEHTPHSTLNFIRGYWKSAAAAGFNICRGRWQMPLLFSHCQCPWKVPICSWHNILVGKCCLAMTVVMNSLHFAFWAPIALLLSEVLKLQLSVQNFPPSWFLSWGTSPSLKYFSLYFLMPFVLSHSVEINLSFWKYEVFWQLLECVL